MPIRISALAILEIADWRVFGMKRGKFLATCMANLGSEFSPPDCMAMNSTWNPCSTKNPTNWEMVMGKSLGRFLRGRRAKMTFFFLTSICLFGMRMAGSAVMAILEVEMP